jgi:hypothetical protein
MPDVNFILGDNAAATSRDAAKALTQANRAEAEADEAAVHANTAGNYAETARSLVGGAVYEDTTAGIAAASDGEFFVVANDTEHALYRNDSDTAVFVRDLAPDDYVTPEMFGEVGADPDDNALLIAAVASGKPVRLTGPLYRFRSDSGATNPAVFTSGKVVIEASDTAEIRNVQPSGTKLPAIRCEGSEGSSTSVTQIGDDDPGLHKTITVASVAGLSKGDWCILREADNVVAEPDPIFPQAPNQNIAYWEYVRIDAINGSVITTEAYLLNEWYAPHDGGYGNEPIALNSITLTKVELGPEVSIKGGKWTGGPAAGGGIGVKYCRKPSLTGAKFEGLSDADNLGGAAVHLAYNIEPSLLDIKADRTLFVANLFRNFAGLYGHVQGNRTGNGTLGGAPGASAGIIFDGDMAPKAYGANLFAPGKYNGDSYPIGGGTRYGSFDLKTHGSHCYTCPVRFGSDHNKINVEAHAGITGLVALAGAHNTVFVKSRGHPSSVVAIYGDNNTVHMQDCESYSIALILNSGHSGNRVTGAVRSLAANKIAVQIGDVVETTLDIDMGDSIHNYDAGVSENYSNDFSLRNNVGTSYRLARIFPEMPGWTHRRTLTLTQTAKTIQVPGRGTDTGGLRDLVATSADIGDAFKISLQLNSNLAATYAEYDFLARNGSFSLKNQSANAVDGDGGTYESFIPKIQISGDGTRLELYSEGVTNIPVHMRIEKY